MISGYALTARRALKGKSGTGRKRTKKEMRESLDRYRERLEKKVKVNMREYDYLELSDIATYIRPECAIDIAFRLGYLMGSEHTKENEHG